MHESDNEYKTSFYLNCTPNQIWMIFKIQKKKMWLLGNFETRWCEWECGFGGFQTRNDNLKASQSSLLLLCAWIYLVKYFVSVYLCLECEKSKTNYLRWRNKWYPKMWMPSSTRKLKFHWLFTDFRKQKPKSGCCGRLIMRCCVLKRKNEGLWKKVKKLPLILNV